MIFIATFPQVLAPVRPIFGACQISRARLPPQAGAPFGYDGQGCDVFDSVMWGARPSITIGLLTTLGVTIIGVLLGSLAGFYGGWVDALLSRLTDVMFGFPFLVGAIVILTAFPSRNAYTISFVLIVFGWAGITRIMRSSVFAAKSMDYVQAARALGASNGRIIFRHILPNAITPVLVISTVGRRGHHRRRSHADVPRRRAAGADELVGHVDQPVPWADSSSRHTCSCSRRCSSRRPCSHSSSSAMRCATPSTRSYGEQMTTSERVVLLLAAGR